MEERIVPLKKKGRYVNREETSVTRNLWNFFIWKLRSKRQNFSIPKTFSYPIQKQEFQEEKPSALWINHSTFYLNLEKISFLTDPIWSPGCSPISYIGPKRNQFPITPLETFSSVQLVLISHNHYDHLDERTILSLKKLFPEITYIVPVGVKKWFTKRKIFSVVELNWWDSFSFENLRITAVPAQHFSGRMLWDYNKTLWAGYVIESPQKTCYFAGDTGYNSIDFKKIGEMWKQMDLSLLPIGAYQPKTFMQPIHVDPEEAVQIHLDVHSKFSIGMHWNTFQLTEEPFERPPYDLFLAMQKALLDPKEFIVVEPGTFFNW